MLQQIGAVAKQTGLSPDTLRHYERLALLPTPVRSPGGFRLYAPAAVERVRVIQASLRIGFSLKELASVFQERAAGRAPCRRVRRLAGEKLEALEREIRALQRLRVGLKRTLARFDERLEKTPEHARAHLLDSLVSGAG